MRDSQKSLSFVITVVDVNGPVTEDAATPTLTNSGSVTFAEIDDTDVLTSSVVLATTATTGPAIPSGLATALSSALSLTQTGTNDGTIVWDFALSNSLTQYLAAGETVKYYMRGVSGTRVVDNVWRASARVDFKQNKFRVTPELEYTKATWGTLNTNGSGAADLNQKEVGNFRAMISCAYSF